MQHCHQSRLKDLLIQNGYLFPEKELKLLKMEQSDNNFVSQNDFIIVNFQRIIY